MARGTREARGRPARTISSDSGGKADVADPFDVALEDADLLREVEMTTSLIIAASASDGPLPIDEIDRILGVGPAA